MAAGFTRMAWVQVRGTRELWRVESVETAADGTELITCRPADVYHGGAARTFPADELEAVPDPYQGGAGAGRRMAESELRRAVEFLWCRWSRVSPGTAPAGASGSIPPLASGRGQPRAAPRLARGPAGLHGDGGRPFSRAARRRLPKSPDAAIGSAPEAICGTSHLNARMAGAEEDGQKRRRGCVNCSGEGWGGNRPTGPVAAGP